MKTLVYRMTLAALLVGQCVALSACDEDEEEPGTDGGSANAADAGGRGGRGRSDAGTERPGAGGAGGPVAAGELCRVAATQSGGDVPKECVGCVCDAVAACGEPCQALLLCVISKCMGDIQDTVKLGTCALQNCSSEITSGTAITAVTQAVGSLSSCGDACGVEGPLMPPTGSGPTSPGSDQDAGAASEDGGTADDAGQQ